MVIIFVAYTMNHFQIQLAPSNTDDGGLISTPSIPLDASSDTDGSLISTTLLYLESDVTNATNVDPESSQNDYTGNYGIP